MTKLALFGGSKTVTAALPEYNAIGAPEAAAVADVMKSGILSGYYGSWSPQFMGGPLVQKFESDLASIYGSKHAVAINSNTSGLWAALAAIGLSPGDEVIVSPYSMSASAVTPLFFGAVPIFADIEPDAFTICPRKVESLITSRTRAILAVNIFGHPAHLRDLRSLADRRGIVLLEDNAQAPTASEFGRRCGTVGHIGILSFNYHKHVHTGEGGACLTDDSDLAFRMQAVRNHAENVVEPSGIADLTNMIGLNLRMTELSAAIGIEQHKRIDAAVAERVRVAETLTAAVAGLDGIVAPRVRTGCTHVYYIWGARFVPEILGCSRETFVSALAAEGVPIYNGYVRPVYRLPAFQRRIAIGRDGFPFNLTKCDYTRLDCPTIERVESAEMATIETCFFKFSDAGLSQIAEAFAKVHASRADLVDFEKREEK